MDNPSFVQTSAVKGQKVLMIIFTCKPKNFRVLPTAILTMSPYHKLPQILYKLS